MADRKVEIEHQRMVCARQVAASCKALAGFLDPVISSGVSISAQQPRTVLRGLLEQVVNDATALSEVLDKD